MFHFSFAAIKSVKETVVWFLGELLADLYKSRILTSRVSTSMHTSSHACLVCVYVQT